MSEDKITITMDESNLTIGDMETIEEVAGGLGEGVSEIKMTLALVLIELRKTNPAATLEDARAVKVTQLDTTEAGGSDAVDPTS